MSTKRVVFEDEEGFEIELKLPCVWEVCQDCRGNGTHVNRNIDGNGITASEWAEWDDDEKEGYFRGDYDVTCETCRGRTTVQVIDEERAALAFPEEWHKYEEWLAADTTRRESDYEDAYLRRMESGGH